MKKALLILYIVFLLGVPLNTFCQFFILTLSLGLVFCGTWQLQKKIFPWLIIFGLGIFSKFLSPLHIEEGHQILVDAGGKIMDPLEWVKEKKVPAAFSADGFWHYPKYSRIVEGINFQGLIGARLGAINDLSYNFYPPHSSYIRENLPFLIAYVFPPEAVGLTLNFQGKSFWPTSSEGMEEIIHSSLQGRVISKEIVGEPVYFVGGDLLKGVGPVSSLEVSLEKNTKQKIIECAKLISIIFSIVLLIYSTLEFKNKFNFYLYIGTICTQFLYLAFVPPISFKGLFPLISGWDGLTYYGWGREILRNIYTGNIYEALKGVEPVFYFMPGFRYIRAGELALFGDTYYGYVLFFMFIPVILFKFLRYFFSQKISLGLLLIFFIPINFCSRYLGFSDYFYLNHTIFGHGEPFAYILFIAGILLIFRGMDTHKHTFWAHFLLFITATCRPNLALAIFFLMGIYALWILKNANFQEALKKLFLSWIGFVPIFLFPLHNYYFGGKFVLLTTAATIPENLPTPPLTYWQGLKALILGDLHNPALLQIGQQLSEWNRYGLRMPLIILALYYVFKASLFSRIGILARMGVILHIQFLFYNTNIRYAYIAWFLVFIIFIDALLQRPLVKKWIASLNASLVKIGNHNEK